MREVETERDGLSGRLEATQRALIEHHAAGSQIKPAALWASGVATAELLDADGNVDADKVQQACQAAVETLGLMRRPKPDRTQGGGARGAGASGEPSPWSEALSR